MVGLSSKPNHDAKFLSEHRFGKDETMSCIFWDDISCKHRKSRTAVIMIRCWRCREFRRFVRQMDKSDARLMDEIEKERGSNG